MATKAEHVTALKAEHPQGSLTRQVNGVRSALSTAEYDAKIDEWATVNAAKDVEDDVRENGGVSANYAEHRRNAYPSSGDQLDMQYHDAINGTTTWIDAIAAVKNKYGKPS